MTSLPAIKRDFEQLLINLTKLPQPWNTTDIHQCYKGGTGKVKAIYGIKYYLIQRGFIENDPKNNHLCSLTKAAEQYLIDLGADLTKPNRVNTENSRSAKKATDKTAINISSTANNVADGIAALIEENSDMRKLLTEIHNQIAEILQL